MEDPTLQALEVFCICWFSFEVRTAAAGASDAKDGCLWKRRLCVLEVGTRLLLAPNRRKFFRHPLNIIDLVSVVPIYITLVFDVTLGSESELGNLGRLIQVSPLPSSRTASCWGAENRLTEKMRDLPGLIKFKKSFEIIFKHPFFSNHLSEETKVRSL